MKNQSKMLFLEIFSHPGQGFFLLRPKCNKIHSIEYHRNVVSNKKISIILCGDGKIFWRKSDGAQLTVLDSCKKGEGVFLSKNTTSSNAKSLRSKVCLFDFLGNGDGYISTCDDIGVFFVMVNFTLMIVPRISPNRLVVKHGKSLFSN